MAAAGAGESPRFEESRGPLGRLLRRADVDPRELEAELGRFLQGGARALKVDRKTSVFAGLSLTGRPVCLKVYRRARRGRRGFEALRRLGSRGVPVPQVFFFWLRSREAGRGAVVGMEDLSPRRELDRWAAALLEPAPLEPAPLEPAPLEKGPPGKGPRGERNLRLRQAAASLGALLRGLHGQGIDLDDLKTCNIFLEEEAFLEKGRPEEDGGAPRFWFVDLDRSSVGGPLSLPRRARRLAALNRSTPRAAGLAVRLAFWKEYRRGLGRREARALRRRVTWLSVQSPILYVSPAGVKEEVWPRLAREWPR